MVFDFGDVNCSYFINIVPFALNEFNKTPNSKIYVIYYEGKHNVSNIWSKKLNRYESKLLNPRRGDALNRAKEVGLFFKEYKFSINNLVLINGGFREDFTLEFWLVPNNAEPPKPTPTISEKEVRFRKGKPFKTRACARIYDDL